MRKREANSAHKQKTGYRFKYVYVVQVTPDGPYSELSEQKSYAELVTGSRSVLSAAKILCIFLSFTFLVLGGIRVHASS